MPRLFGLTAFALGVVLAACGGDADPGVSTTVTHDNVVTTLTHGDPDLESETPIATTTHGPVEGWMSLSLRLGATQEEIDAVESAVASAAPEAQYSYEENWLQFDIASGHEDDVTDCFLWALPAISVSYDPSSGDGQAIVDAVEPLDVVVQVDAFGLETTKGFEEEGYDEVQIECDTRLMVVLVDPDANPDIETIRAKAASLEGVVATAVESQDAAAFFVPDLSGYPELEACYGPDLTSIWVFFETADQQAMNSAISHLEGSVGVAGFNGMTIDPSLDPIHEFDEQVDWEKCEGVEGYVHLVLDITDEQAAVVVARAAAIEGVADINLLLIDPASIEPCRDDDGSGEGHYDCFVPSSELTIYRGDLELASPQVVADALCDLPGVLSISVYDKESHQEFADPYETCGSLNLTVFLDSNISQDAASAVGSAVTSIDNVITVDGPYFADYETPEQVVVVGELDPLVCLNDAETAPTLGVQLERVSRAEADDIVSEISNIEGVQAVLGNAIGRQPWDPTVCGFDGLSIHISPDMSAEDQQNLFALFEDRSDVQAVVMELPFEVIEGDEDRQWVAVKFNSDKIPDDLDELAAKARGIPGVLEAEVWEWQWEESAG